MAGSRRSTVWIGIGLAGCMLALLLASLLFRSVLFYGTGETTFDRVGEPPPAAPVKTAAP